MSTTLTLGPKLAYPAPLNVIFVNFSGVSQALALEMALEAGGEFLPHAQELIEALVKAESATMRFLSSSSISITLGKSSGESVDPTAKTLVKQGDVRWIAKSVVFRHRDPGDWTGEQCTCVPHATNQWFVHPLGLQC